MFAEKMFFAGTLCWRIVEQTAKISCHTASQAAVSYVQEVRPRGADGLVICGHVLANHLIGR